MIEFATVVVAILIGILLGVVFFGGLWITVRKIGETDQFATRYFASFVIRMAIMIGGLFLVLKLGIVPLFFAVSAMLLVRVLMIRRISVAQTSNQK